MAPCREEFALGKAGGALGLVAGIAEALPRLLRELMSRTLTVATVWSPASIGERVISTLGKGDPSMTASGR